jgi:hypothetical protein
MDTFAHSAVKKKNVEEIVIAVYAAERTSKLTLEYERVFLRFSESNAGKLKMRKCFFAHAVEWIFPQASFSVWILVFVIQVAFDGSRADVQPCKESQVKEKKGRRQSKCESCCCQWDYYMNKI